MKTVITKQELKELDACADGYKKFITANGGSATLSQALSSNGWDDIWWYVGVAYEKFTQEQKNELHLLGCDWAESCLINFEKEFPEDKRPRLAMQAKRDFVAGKISEEDLSAARSAAWSAARSAAWSAAWSAARSAESAAWSAESTARSAAMSAESTAWSAAMDAMANDLMQLFLKWENVK